MLIELGQQFWQELVARTDGPFAFRFLLQPIMAAGLATRDGIRDAKLGRAPYLWTIATRPERRRAQLKEGLRATMRVLMLAAGLDLAYQLLVLHAIRPLETAVVALGLGFLPYLVLRGPIARIATRRRKWSTRRSRTSS
jgi:hypothetical protein